VLYSVFKTGLDGTISDQADLRKAKRFLPDNIYDAMDNFSKADWTKTLFSEEVKERYVDLKKGSADRCARLLGTMIKSPEIQFHHEVYNQYLWNQF
jgi:glutamine synthetase